MKCGSILQLVAGFVVVIQLFGCSRNVSSKTDSKATETVAVQVAETTKTAAEIVAEVSGPTAETFVDDSSEIEEVPEWLPDLLVRAVNEMNRKAFWGTVYKGEYSRFYYNGFTGLSWKTEHDLSSITPDQIVLAMADVLMGSYPQDTQLRIADAFEIAPIRDLKSSTRQEFCRRVGPLLSYEETAYLAWASMESLGLEAAVALRRVPLTDDLRGRLSFKLWYDLVCTLSTDELVSGLDPKNQEIYQFACLTLSQNPRELSDWFKRSFPEDVRKRMPDVLGFDGLTFFDGSMNFTTRAPKDLMRHRKVLLDSVLDDDKFSDIGPATALGAIGHRNHLEEEKAYFKRVLGDPNEKLELRLASYFFTMDGMSMQERNSHPLLHFWEVQGLDAGLSDERELYRRWAAGNLAKVSPEFTEYVGTLLNPRALKAVQHAWDDRLLELVIQESKSLQDAPIETVRSIKSNLLKALEDDSEFVRFCAALAIGRLSDDELGKDEVDALSARIKGEESPGVLFAVLWALKNQSEVEDFRRKQTMVLALVTRRTGWIR